MLTMILNYSRFKRRCAELSIFLRNLVKGTGDPINGSRRSDVRKLGPQASYKHRKRRGQKIELRRHQDQDPVDGQRTLSWDLGVDQEVLREMMEILGPPGVFIFFSQVMLEQTC